MSQATEPGLHLVGDEEPSRGAHEIGHGSQEVSLGLNSVAGEDGVHEQSGETDAGRVEGGDRVAHTVDECLRTPHR